MSKAIVLFLYFSVLFVYLSENDDVRVRKFTFMENMPKD